MNSAVHLTAALPFGTPPLAIFFALAIGHALADFSLQGDFLSTAKNRHADIARFFGGNRPPKALWVHALTAHALIHAGAVWLVTGSAALAAIELLVHWLIDFSKCEGWTSFTTDQFLHFACKAAYAVALTSMPALFANL